MDIEAKPQPPLTLPEKLGRHEIVTNLGHGGMAQVFLAVQRGPFSSTKLVVIKKLKPDAGGDQQFLDMFLDEARIAMRLSHPNVVSTFDFVADGDEFYLTMEFLDGQSLLQTIRKVGRDRMPLELHIWVLTQVLAGLGYAHGLRDFDGTALDIVHRDVTPSNVILTYGGGVKLVDFGIAKVAGAVAVTQSGMMKGKLGYVSPEQCLGKPTTARSDLYSVGVMLWEAMARKRRTVGETPAAVYQARIAGTERSIEDVWLDAPPSLVKIVKRALAAAPENRYETAFEFQRELEEYLAGTPREGFGTRALAEFMTAHFAAAMETLHRTIESRVAGALRGLTASSGPISTEVTHTVEKPVWAASPPKATGATSAPRVANRIEPSKATDTGKAFSPSQIKMGAAIAAVAVVVAGLATFAALRRGDSPRPELAAAADVQAAPPLPAAAAGNIAPLPPRPPRAPSVVPQGAPPARAEAATPELDEFAEVRILVKPRSANARVMLDGEPLAGNPAVARRQKGSFQHTLSVTAEGYEPLERVVTTEQDVRLTLKLARARPGEPGAAALANKDTARARGHATDSGGPAASEPRKTSPANAAPTAPEDKPGMDLRRRPTSAGGARHIDEKDPYTP